MNHQYLKNICIGIGAICILFLSGIFVRKLFFIPAAIKNLEIQKFSDKVTFIPPIHNSIAQVVLDYCRQRNIISERNQIIISQMLYEDLDNDLQEDTIILGYKIDGAHILVLDNSKNYKIKFSGDNDAKDNDSFYRINKIVVDDLNKDNFKEIIVYAENGGSGGYVTCIVYDLHKVTGKIIFKSCGYEFPEFRDIDHDGRKEIIWREEVIEPEWALVQSDYWKNNLFWNIEYYRWEKGKYVKYKEEPETNPFYCLDRFLQLMKAKKYFEAKKYVSGEIDNFIKFFDEVEYENKKKLMPGDKLSKSWTCYTTPYSTDKYFKNYKKGLRKGNCKIELFGFLGCSPNSGEFVFQLVKKLDLENNSVWLIKNVKKLRY